MWNAPSTARLQKIPGLYTTEETPTKDKLIHLHFFIGSCDWYVIESDDHGVFWGFVILNGDYDNAEFGYFLQFELEQIRINGWMEVDCELEGHWKIRPASQVDKISQVYGWNLEVV